MIKTLAEGLKPASVSFKILHERYSPLLELVRTLIGVVPNCDPLLEIWPPGFRTYNLLVPNMLNLPATLFGSKSFKASLGLALYASSKASCAYCTAHTCSFALRRGASAHAITGLRSPKEQAVVTLAERLAAVPCQLTFADISTVRRHFSVKEAEQLVYAIGMMGFLNKFMSVMGVELEQEAINDTAALLSKTGWLAGIHAGDGYHISKTTVPAKDNLLTYLRVIRYAPGAVRWEKQWIKDVPTDRIKTGEYLRQHTGYDFPILKPIRHSRVRRALTAILRDNLSKEQTRTGLKIKMLAATIFCEATSNIAFASEVKIMIGQIMPGLNNNMLMSAAEMARRNIPVTGEACNELMGSIQRQFSLTDAEAACILLAIAASHSPARMNDAVVEATLHNIEPAGIAEIVVWLAVLEMLNRLTNYYAIVAA